MAANPIPPDPAAGAPDVREDPFTSVLAACDDALAAGDDPVPAAADDSTPELRDRLIRAVACMRLLRTALAAPDAVTSRSGGRRLGDFQVGREIGRGGMGVVYEARQVSLNRPVALKVLGPGLGLSRTAVERFRREAEAAARLHHAHIVPIYATGEDAGTHYYAMELVAGPSLDQVLSDIRHGAGPGRLPLPTPGPRVDGPASTAHLAAAATDRESRPPAGSWLGSDRGYFDTVARLVAEVADALQYAHREGVIHRDVKPGNLLLAPDGRLRVNDFGLARLLEEPAMTATGDFVGTPAYMSPEQIGASRAVDCRTDVYSLGATLYEMLTLRPPFAGESRAAVVAQVLQADPVPPRRVNPGVPRDLDTICLKALEKGPARRYPSAAELAVDLRRFLAGQPVAARRVGALGRAWKAARRRPVVAGLLAVVAVLAAGGAVAVTALWQQAESALAGERAARRDETAQRGQAEAELAAKLVLLARIEWEAAHTARAADYLRKCPEAHRGREWQYLDRACRMELMSFPIQSGPTARVVYSPDGRVVAAASVSGVLKAWDLATRTEVFATNVSPVSFGLDLSFTPDGRQLVFAYLLPSIRSAKPPPPTPWKLRMWDVDTWRLVRESRFEDNVPGMPVVTGTARASVDGELIRVKDLVSGQTREFAHGHKSVDHLVFSDGGRFLMSTGRSEPLKVWEAGTGRLVSAGPVRPIRLHPVLREQLNADGRRVVWFGLADSDASVSITVWDLEHDREVGTVRVASRTLGTVRLSPDGAFLAVVEDRTAVRVWDVATTREVATLRGHTDRVWDVAFGADRRIATVGQDHTVRVWGVSPCEE